MKAIIQYKWFAIFSLACLLACSGNSHEPDETPQEKLNVLVFSKTGGFRHECIEPGGAALKTYFEERDMVYTQTEDPGFFTDNKLTEYDAVIFFQTTGNVLDSLQQESLVKFIKSGKGFVGIHAAADAEYDWPWYAALVGAQFASHPHIQQATIVKVDTHHLACKHLPERWSRTDEWYNFKQVPTGVNVLLTLDETTYQGGEHDSLHPMAWYHDYDGGRSFYTGLGHTVESYSDTLFLKHVYEGVKWAAGN